MRSAEPAKKSYTSIHALDVSVSTGRMPPVFTSKKMSRISFWRRLSVTIASVSARLVQ